MMSNDNSSLSDASTGVPEKGTNVEVKGWLYKWTNYVKGYQKRWFVLQDGSLSYYRNQGEVEHFCRGSINLRTAYVYTEDNQKFIIHGGSCTFHLKAANEAERQRWITAMELSRVRAIKAESDEEEEGEPGNNGRAELQTALGQLQRKLEDLVACQDMVVKHGTTLQKSLAEFDVQAHDDRNKAKLLNERSTLFRITTNAMITACDEFVALSLAHSRKWQRLMQHEHDQRKQLEKTVEQLARQHSVLEVAVAKQAKEQGLPVLSGTAFSEDDEEEFHDAIEHPTNRQKSLKKQKQRSAEDSDQEDDKFYETAADSDLARLRVVVQQQALQPPDALRKSDSTNSIAVSAKKPARQYRKAITPSPNISVSLWGIMKNCIGKDLSKIPMPVNFNEPLSMLQRLTEDLEYSRILDRAAQCTDACEQLAYVACFTVSSYSTTAERTGKPFNPLLGETFECDRRDDLGWRSICEQVSHHPPAAAMHVESSEWTLWQEFTMSSKFRGKYLQIIPLGISHLEFKKSGNHYTWRKVTTCVNNIIVGKLWIDNYGDMSIDNHTTGDKCFMKFQPYSFFSNDTPRKVTGLVRNKDSIATWVVQGTWDNSMETCKIVKGGTDSKHDKGVYETETPKTVWKKNAKLPHCEQMYNFTEFAVTLNEPEVGVAPTDSRQRPDQRLMENGKWPDADKEKQRLEEKQRAVRRHKETEAERAIQEGKPYEEHSPAWFTKQKDQWTGNLLHVYAGQYWQAKEKHDWTKCPDIF